MNRRLATPLAFTLAPLLCAQTQQPDQRPDQQSVRQDDTLIRSRTTLVTVPTLVQDTSGQIVFALKAEDFTVTDDGEVQQLRLVEDTDDQPISLVVAVQTGGTGAKRLENYHNLAPLVEGMVGNVPHHIAVVRFDSSSRVGLDFTSDWSEVKDTLQNLKPGDPGAAILDSLAFSVDLLRKEPAGYRRAVLILSETIDHGSQVTLEDAVRAISDTNTAIYSAAFSTTKAQMKHELHEFNARDEPGPTHGCMGSATTLEDDTADPKEEKEKAGLGKKRAKQSYDCLSLLAPPLRLAKMAVMAVANDLKKNVPETVANLTGGDYFPMSDDRSLEQDIIAMTHRLPNRYVLSFQPHSPHPGLHTIQVRLKEYPKLEVTARSRYWADRDASAQP